MMHVLFNWAMRGELIPFQINPMNLVHIKGSSKREREPRTLPIEEYRQFIEKLVAGNIVPIRRVSSKTRPARLSTAR
jgi:integrase